MSVNLTDIAIEAFEAEIKHEYQGKSVLRECVNLRTNVTGDKYNFNVMGKGTATVRTGSSADIVPLNISYNLMTATLVDYEAAEFSDIWDQATTRVEEITELASTLANSVSRRDDQSIIDALATTTTTPVGDGTLAMSLSMVTAAAQALNAVEAPMEDRYLVITEKGLNDLLNDEKLTSADYSTVRALQSGTINSFMGFEFKVIGSARAEGGLPKVTTVQTSFAFHRASIGHAVGLDLDVRVDYVAHKGSYLSLCAWKAGSVAIDVEGIIPIESLA